MLYYYLLSERNLVHRGNINTQIETYLSTLWSIKTGHYIIGDNFVKCNPIFTTFALLQRKNFQQNPCNIFHFTLTLV